MNFILPRYVLLDTSTLNIIADNPLSGEAVALLKCFDQGEFLPFITCHQLQEMAQHQDRNVFLRRYAFLGRFRQIAYLRKSGMGDTVGNCVTLRDHEITFILEHPGCSYQDVVDKIMPIARSGLSSGEDLVRENEAWWNFNHDHLAADTLQEAVCIANLTHFGIGNPKDRIPCADQPVKVCSEEEAARRFARMGTRLSARIKENGDPRQKDAFDASMKLMREAFDESRDMLGKGPILFDEYLRTLGVDRERLPEDPKMEDVGYEAVFVAQMGTHAKRLLRPKEELLRAVRKEQMPSWVVWMEIDRRIKSIKKAEGSNLGDKHIASFGPYVDVLDVDKRIGELLRQAGRTHALLSDVSRRVPLKKGLRGLLSHLEKF